MHIYANQMLPVPTTLFSGMPPTLWDATDFKQITLGKKSFFAAVYFPFELKYHMHTNFCGMFNSIFAIIFLQDIVCLKMCDPCGLPL